MAQPAKGLGKGLSALMGDNAPAISAAESSAITKTETAPDRLAVSAIVAGKYQPRRHFDDEALMELADSVERHGIMQPIVVREVGQSAYEIIAGERRFRAAQLANLTEVPVIIRELTDAQALELALIENIQRADLNPLEEAAGYQRLMDEFKYTQEKLAPIVGKSRSHIANLLRLLKLPESIKKQIDTGALTMGHARALLMAKEPEALAKQIVEVGLSVRQAEELAKGIQPEADKVVELTPNGAGASRATKPAAPRGGAAPQTLAKSEDVLQLESMLCDSLGLQVSINTLSGQAGEVVIRYETLTQLDEILRRLGGSV